MNISWMSPLLPVVQGKRRKKPECRLARMCGASWVRLKHRGRIRPGVFCFAFLSVKFFHYIEKVLHAMNCEALITHFQRDTFLRKKCLAQECIHAFYEHALFAARLNQLPIVDHFRKYELAEQLRSVLGTTLMLLTEFRYYFVLTRQDYVSYFLRKGENNKQPNSWVHTSFMIHFGFSSNRYNNWLRLGICANMISNPHQHDQILRSTSIKRVYKVCMSYRKQR